MSTPESGSTRTATRPIDTGATPQDQTTKDQAKQAAGTAADQTQHVAGVARGEAQRVADEARSHARGLFDQATSQLEDQSRTQKDRLADTVGSFAHDLDSMASQQGGGLAADLAREVADRARTASAHLQDREPRELLDDVRGFARRRPGVFLGGALVAGMVVGRMARAARDDHASTGQGPGQGSGQVSGQTTADRPVATSGPLRTGEHELGTAAGTPLAGTGTPPPEVGWSDDGAGGRL